MTQRNPMNERYTDENRTGKTRKSSASAKPKAARAATVRDPAPKTKQQKKAERKERERKEAEKAEAVSARFEQTEGYKKLRRIWWAMLIGAVVMTAASFAVSRFENMTWLTAPTLVIAYALIIGAFIIDLGKIRKERKIYNASIAKDNSKAARKEQKRLKAEKKAQEAEAAEKFEAAKAAEDEKKANRGGLFGLFGKSKKADDAAAEGESPADEGADSQKGANETGK